MFLFTTPSPTATPQPGAGSPVVDAIRQGASATGADFDYLLQTAKRESALNPTAKAPTSSASGLFQFIEQTWLGLVKSDGDKAGLADEARAVSARGDGSYAVADPEARQAILKLREDPQIASVMAGALTQQNRDALTGALGRAPSTGELYMAHVLGARGAATLIGAKETDPTRAAALDFPEAARANRALFYDRSGRPRGAGEVYAAIAALQANSAPSQATSGGADATGGQSAAFRSKGLDGLFQTGSRTGPISDAVARIWRTHASTPGPAARTSLAFFPRTADGSSSDDGASADATATTDASPADVATAAWTSTQGQPAGPAIPLPPVRPSAAVLAGSGTARRPLNLRAFAENARP